MPWKEKTAMSCRHEFVLLASQPGAVVRELCRRHGISPKTGYKWLARYQADGAAGLADRSRRPVHTRSAPRRRWSAASWRCIGDTRIGDPASCGCC